MRLHDQVSYDVARLLTSRYSSSFHVSSRLFAARLRLHIYAIYGLVRIADEIVDTYRGADQSKLLDDLEVATYAAIERGYHPEPIVHAFALTARRYEIDRQLIEPFFDSMRLDIQPRSYDEAQYTRYIHGSAEVIGLMCLKVFCEGDADRYDSLRDGAAALGSAYQKVNFLRDLAADHEMGRWYFPEGRFEAFDDEAKQRIVDDITHDFERARISISQLPRGSRVAVASSYRIYRELLQKLHQSPAETLRDQRIRVSSVHKIWLVVVAIATRGRV